MILIALGLGGLGYVLAAKIARYEDDGGRDCSAAWCGWRLRQRSYR